MRSGTELMRSTASAGDISSWSSIGQTLHTQMDAADAGMLRNMRGRARSERRLLRALCSEDEACPAPGEDRDQGRAALLSFGGWDRDRLHLDLLGTEVVPTNGREVPSTGHAG